MSSFATARAASGKSGGFFFRSIAIAWAVAWAVVMSSSVRAQITSTPRAMSGPGNEQSQIRVRSPSLAEFPVITPQNPNHSAAADSLPEDTKGADVASKPVSTFEDRLQSLNMMPSTTPRVARKVRGWSDDGSESPERLLYGADPLESGNPRASWRRGASPGSKDSTAESSRLRSSLWRRGSRAAGGIPEAFEERLMRGSASKREVTTGGVRAGAPPARPGYGAPTEPTAGMYLNAARSLFLDSDPQRSGGPRVTGR